MGMLDLHGQEGVATREDPEKLIVLSVDSLNLYTRSENSKGVVMFSLFDGAAVIENSQMHTNYIFEMLVTRDKKKLFTCGKDKKIKVWDWIR
mmetsp:Transcript_47197/g.34504  ORF Transcript_47197/g.34504 Transcript_47197/m.34504 type:complete len:92 (+) Transcript_47197:625-900(+)